MRAGWTGWLAAAGGLLAAVVPVGLAPGPAAADPEVHRGVEGRTLTSTALPAITVRVSSEFTYAGRVEFQLGDEAAGERYIFVDAPEGKVRKLFIFQFEGFLEGSDNVYRYDFSRAMELKGHRFRHNTYAFSNAVEEREHPQAEAALTVKLLREKGLRYEDEWMMSRFVTVPDEARRHELILFYVENVSASGHRLAEFIEGDRETDIWKEISGRLKRRSLSSFDILPPPAAKAP